MLFQQLQNVVPSYAARAELFIPTRLPPRLVGVDRYLLSDLHDLVSNYGVLTTGGKKVFYDKTPGEISVVVKPNIEKQVLMTVRRDGESVRDQSNGNTFMILRAGEISGFILWSKNVSVCQLRSFITRMDSKMCTQGFIDATTGERSSIYDLRVKGALHVDDIFVRREQVVRVPQTGPDPKAFIRRFDRKRDLTIIRKKDEYLICRKEDVTRIVQRIRLNQEATDNVYQRRGLASQEEFDRLPERRRMAILNEIDRETAKAMQRLDDSGEQ